MSAYDLWKKDREEKEKESKASAYEQWKKERDQKLISQGISPAVYDLNQKYQSWATGYNDMIATFKDRFSGRKFNYEEGYLGETGSWLQEYEKRRAKLDRQANDLRGSLMGSDLGEDTVAAILAEIDSASANEDKMLAQYQSLNKYYSQFADEADWNMRSYEAAKWRLDQHDAAKKGDKSAFERIGAAVGEGVYKTPLADPNGNLTAPFYDMDIMTVYNQDYYDKYKDMSLYSLNAKLRQNSGSKWEKEWLNVYYKQRENEWVRTADVSQIVSDYNEHHIDRPQIGTYTGGPQFGGTVWTGSEADKKADRAEFYYDLLDKLSVRDTQKWIGFNEVADPNSQNYDPDFEKIAAKTVSTWDGPFAPTTNDDRDPFWALGYRDPTYEYIVNDAWWLHNLDSTKYEAMTEQEKKKYAYWYHKAGQYKADEYLDLLTPELEVRAGKAAAKTVEGKPWLQIPFGFAIGVARVPEQVSSWLEDEPRPATALEVANGQIRGDLAEVGPAIPKWLGGQSLGQAGYDITYTLGNMAPAMAISTVNPAAGAALMGASTGGDAYMQKLRDGWHPLDAAGFGLLVGISEAAFEYVLGSVGKVGKVGLSKWSASLASSMDNVYARIVRNGFGRFVVGGFSEAVEEGLQTVLEPIFESWFTGKYTPAKFEEVAYNAVLGYITGGLVDGVSTGPNGSGPSTPQAAALSPKSLPVVESPAAAPGVENAALAALPRQTAVPGRATEPGSTITDPGSTQTAPDSAVTDPGSTHTITDSAITDPGGIQTAPARASKFPARALGQAVPGALEAYRSHALHHNVAVTAEALQSAGISLAQAYIYADALVSDAMSLPLTDLQKSNLASLHADPVAQATWNRLRPTPAEPIAATQTAQQTELGFADSDPNRPTEQPSAAQTQISDAEKGNDQIDPLDTQASNGIIKERLTAEDKQAILKYMSAASYTINEKLRTSTPIENEEMILVSNLNIALDKMPKYKGNLRRSLYFDEDIAVQKFVAEYVPGESIKYKEFLSATKGRELYNPDGQVQIFIRDSENGRDISSINDDEQEVLYKTGSEFVVVDKIGENGKYFILLEEKQ